MTTISNNQFMVLDSWENACDNDVEFNIPSNVKVEIANSSSKTPPKTSLKTDMKTTDNIQEELEVASLTDFPSLAMSKEVKSTKNDKGYTVMHIPQKYYKEQKHEEIKSKRTEAFEKLANKETLSDRLYKTSICRSVINMGECLHGEKCRFAHSLEELRTSCCLFGKHCRFVKCNNESWTNIGNKMCTHMHPNESRGGFLTRIGVDISNIPKHTPKIEAKIEPIVSTNLDIVSPKTPSKKFPHPIEKVVNAIKTKTYGEDEAELKETVIRVPAALSQQALEMALKSGMQTFRVEVV